MRDTGVRLYIAGISERRGTIPGAASSTRGSTPCVGDQTASLIRPSSARANAMNLGQMASAGSLHERGHQRALARAPFSDVDVRRRDSRRASAQRISS